MQQDLKILRQQIRAQRKDLHPDLQAQASHNIVAQIIALPVFQQSNKIGLYLATEGEIELTPLINTIWQQEKSCFLPVISPSNKTQLEFMRYAKNDILEKNQYNILEPVFNPAKLLSPQELDLVITPLVAFNSQGYRLGRGAGYYDKTFAYKLAAPQMKPFLLGVAYKFQQLDFMPNQWDVPLQQVITNS